MFKLLRRLFKINRRRETRILRPGLTLTIERKAYETFDWGMGGFRITGFKRDIKVGETIEGQIGEYRGSKGGSFTAAVVRLTDDDGFGACWSDIDRDIFTAMSGPGGV
jgi:hypothetical protein